MATIPGIRGMLLEEALLFLLEVSGYTVVEDATVDPETLQNGHSGLEVLGRGGVHQIDAIADYVLAHPFSNPQRLLVEAKCLSDRSPVGLEIIRNALGVRKDVDEYWVSRAGLPSKSRYHYQYAIFSASGYTVDAERYAYAHDIYLIPLEDSLYMRPIIDSIRDISHTDFGAAHWRSVNVNMKDLRHLVRNMIRRGYVDILDYEYLNTTHLEAVGRFCYVCRNLQGALLAMISNRFPVFLMPSPDIDIKNLNDRYNVYITYDIYGWYLNDINGRRLFSFDIPMEIFNIYADNGLLTKRQAFNLEMTHLSTIRSIMTVDGYTKAITFELDPQWIERVREGFHRKPRRYEN